MRRRVFYFVTTLNPSERMDYSYEPIDFESKSYEGIIFFWIPHLKRLGQQDLLGDLWRRKVARDDAARRITGFVQAKYIRLIHQEFDGRPRQDACSRLKRLYKHEIKRAQVVSRESRPYPYFDPIFFQCNQSERDRMQQFADSLPEPWDTQIEPVNVPDNTPADRLIEN